MPSLVLVAALFGMWELYVWASDVDALLLPPPSHIGEALWDDRALLWDDLLVTVQEMLLGLAVAAFVGLACAVMLHLSQIGRRAAYPLLIASQAIPIPILAPLLIFWLGFGIAPKIGIVALICFFPIVVATVDALQRVDPDQLKLIRTLDGSRWQALRHVELPAAVPGLLSGAKIAVAASAIAAVLAEYAGSDAGLGNLILNSIPQLETARSFAAVGLLSAFAIGLFALLTLLERRVAPWARRPRP